MTTSSQNEEIKNLVKFMEKFLGFLQDQILAIRQEMTSIVDDVMAGVSSLNQAQAETKKIATTIIIKKQSEAGFQEVSPDERVNAEADLLQKHHTDVEKMITDNVKKAGNQLKEHMKQLKNLDSSLESHLLTMMGALSADDVVGQRLEHVSMALKILKEQISKILEDFDLHLTHSGVERFRNTIHKGVFKTYTMPEEKDCFSKVLGYMPGK